MVEQYHKVVHVCWVTHHIALQKQTNTRHAKVPPVCAYWAEWVTLKHFPDLLTFLLVFL